MSNDVESRNKIRLGGKGCDEDFNGISLTFLLPKNKTKQNQEQKRIVIKVSYYGQQKCINQILL